VPQPVNFEELWLMIEAHHHRNVASDTLLRMIANLVVASQMDSELMRQAQQVIGGE
jgi:hypothetical protein